MRLKIIGSNSAGNAYILENDQEALLIECGVRFDKIKKALGYNLSKVAGCILTHEHGDHAFAAKEVLSAGIDLFASEGTFRALEIDRSYRAIATFSGDQFKVGNFTVKAFDVEHDVNEPLGFIICHPECGNVLFITDSYYCKYNFSEVGLNNVIIEANYCQTILDAKLAAGTNPKFLRDRVITSHMSLDTCKKMLAANDLSQVNKIVLIHLSDGNSHAERFKREVEQVTAKQVFIAEAGLTIENFNRTPF